MGGDSDARVDVSQVRADALGADDVVEGEVGDGGGAMDFFLGGGGGGGGGVFFFFGFEFCFLTLFSSLPVFVPFLFCSPSETSKKTSKNSQLQKQAEGLADASSGAQERDLEA